MTVACKSVQLRLKHAVKGWWVPSASSSKAHGDLDKVIVVKHCRTSLARVPPSEMISQAAQSYATAHEIIEADSAVGAVALHDDVHGLRAQVETHGADGVLQLRALHRSTAVPVVGREGGLPSVQNLAQLLELIKAHGAGHVPIQHADHQPAGLQAERFVCSSHAGLCEAALQLVR